MRRHSTPVATALFEWLVRARAAVIALLLVLAAPVPALACPVCGLAGPGNNGWAYFAMTMMLSIVPLVFIGGVAYWVYRRISAADDASAVATHTVPPRP